MSRILITGMSGAGKSSLLGELSIRGFETIDTDYPYGRSREDQDEIRRYVAEVEPLLRRGATVELDSRRPLTELVDAVAALM